MIPVLGLEGHSVNLYYYHLIVPHVRSHDLGHVLCHLPVATSFSKASPLSVLPCPHSSSPESLSKQEPEPHDVSNSPEKLYIPEV